MTRKNKNNSRPMFKIQIRNEYRTKLIGRRELRKLARDVIEFCLRKELQNRDGEISLMFIDDERMQELNRDYRGLDKPTDVLSFSMDDDDSAYCVLGDVIISIPTAARYADKKKQPLAEELALLLVHGFLHLLSYDDEEPKERKKMMRKQACLLKEYRDQ